MIKGTFQFGGEVQEVIIDGNNLMFADVQGTVTTIEGLRLSKVGVIKEFPDLEGDKEWKEKAIERFKKHINKMEREEDKLNYTKEELIIHGYNPMFYQKAGFRPKKFI